MIDKDKITFEEEIEVEYDNSSSHQWYNVAGVRIPFAWNEISTQYESKAELIKQAFEVFTKTNLTPKELNTNLNSHAISLKYSNEHVLKLQQQNKELTDRNNELLEGLKESNLQIDYLHGKFQETGSGNAIISRNESLINKYNEG